MTIQNYKNIGGKKYEFEWGYPTKAKATSRAKQIKGQGTHMAVVRKENPGQYAVYCRKK